MNKKALTKAIIGVIAVAIYISIACFAVETRHPFLIGMTIGPLILIGLFIIGSVFYNYFDEK